MNGEAALLPVVNRLYAAAAAADQWADALQSLVEAMGADHAILVAGGAVDDGGFVASACVEQQKLLRATSPEALQTGATLQSRKSGSRSRGERLGRWCPCETGNGPPFTTRSSGR